MSRKEYDLLVEEISGLQRKNAALRIKQRKLTSGIDTVQREIEAAKLAIKTASEVQQFFTRCCGVVVDQGLPDTLSLRFTPMCNGVFDVEHVLVLRNVDKCWSFAYCDLPFAIKCVPEKVKAARLTSKKHLCNFICRIRNEVITYVLRKDQFKGVQALLKKNSNLAPIAFYPAVNTLKAALTVKAVDRYTDTLVDVSVFLTYKPTKIFPEEPIFKFAGAGEEMREEFKKQMEAIQEKPLPEALAVSLLNESSLRTSAAVIEESSIASQESDSSDICSTSTVKNSQVQKNCNIPGQSYKKGLTNHKLGYKSQFPRHSDAGKAKKAKRT